MIERLSLENWRTHAKSEFEFGKGTNVLVGSIGAGKSSVMDAICFALFGTFPALNGKRVSQEEVITNKPNPAEKAKVEMDFSYAGKNYRVQRTINRRGSNEAKLFEGERLLAGPKTTAVTERIEGILEVNFDLFSRAVYSEQNQMDYFLRLSPRDRKEKMDELLQLDRYETVRGNAVSALNRLKKTVDDRKKWVEEQAKKFDEKGLEEARKRLKEKEEKAKAVEAEREGAEKALKEKEETLKKLEAKEKEFRALNEVFLGAKGKKSELERELSERKKDAKDFSAEKIAEEEKKNAAEIESQRKKLEENELLEKGTEEKIRQALEKKAQAEARLKDLKEEEQQLGKAKGRCPVCKSELSQEAQHALLEESLLEEKKIAEKAKEFLGEKNKLEEKKALLVKEKKAFERKIDELKEEKAVLKEKADSLKQIEKIELSLKNAVDEMAGAEQKIQKLEFDEQKFSGEKVEFGKAKEKIHALRKEAESQKELAKEISAGIERMEQAKKQIEEAGGKIRGIEEKNEKLSIFVNALKATQAELRESLIGAVNEAMDDIWPRIYPYGDYLSAKIAVDEGEYEVMAKERSGKWVRVEGILSGGERSAVALTLRTAVSLVLAQNLSWLILDEPTHNLDTKTVEGLSEVMRQHLPTLVEQIFIITHDKDMESAATASLYELQREKGADAATNPKKMDF
ncbi:MAG: AAA family ATPase [Candidatus Diapherotrites archaeon]